MTFGEKYRHVIEALSGGSPGLAFALMFLSFAIPVIVIINLLLAVIR